MLQRYQKLWIIALLIASAPLAKAFSLLGPLTTPATTWQVQRIGYSLPGDIGNPVNIGEEYRWNIPNITYAFDDSFLNFFGQQGIDAVEEALAVITDLGPVSNLSPELDEFPLEAIKPNGTAIALGIQDLKSTALAHVLEILGLADAQRYVWVIRNRTVFTNPNATNYFVNQRNFDPVTYVASPFINQDRYNYTIFDDLRLGALVIADAIEEPFSTPDPLPLSRPVSSFIQSGFSFGLSSVGLFLTGLSRDDAGGLRYLYRARNYNVEALATNVILATNGTVGNVVSPWIPYFGLTNFFTNVFGTTNITATNVAVNIALRPGMEAIKFVRANFDSLLGQTLVPVTNIYTDIIISNSTAVLQRVQRTSSQPDLLFTAEDLGFNNGGLPFLTSRGVNFINNDAINGQSVLAGPGILSPPARISFTTVIPGYLNRQPFGFLSGPINSDPFFTPTVWGSFADSPDDIILYPNSFSLQELEQQVLGQ